MVRARLHIICGNCGCGDELRCSIEKNGDDWGDGTFSDSVHIKCDNCGTIHSLDIDDPVKCVPVKDKQCSK